VNSCSSDGGSPSGSTTNPGDDSSGDDSSGDDSSGDDSSGDDSSGDDSIKFVAVGYNGAIITSKNGVTWDNQTSGTTEHLYKIRYLNSKLYATGANGKLLSSQNGTTWSSVNVLNTNSYLQDIFYKNNLYVLVGGADSNSSNYSLIFYSADAINWTKVTTTTQRELTSVTYDTINNRFITVAGGGSSTTGNSIGNSQDGITWAFSGTNFSQNKPIYSVINDGSKIISVGSDGLILSSSDMFNWSQSTSVTNAQLKDLIFVNSKYYSVGRAPGTVLSSNDATNWVVEIQSGIEDLYGITYGESKYIAVGNKGEIISSSDGSIWDNLSVYNSNILSSVIYVENLSN
jgi:hypothetical protein